MKKRFLVFPGLLPVWELIQAMGKREKLRFKEMARLQGGKIPEDENDITYVNFFNVLAAQKVYDKRKIKEKLTGTTTLNDMSDSCSYLYHAVLRSMQAANDEVVAEIADATTQIKILVNKGLNHHVPAMYEKAMEMAGETEAFEDMLKLMRLWKSSLNNLVGYKRWTEDFEAFSTLESEVWAKMLNLREWEHLLDLWTLSRRAKGESLSQILETIATSPLMIENGPCLSVKAEIAKLLLNERPLSNREPNQIERIPKLLEIAFLIEQNPRLFGDTMVVTRYLNIVSNYGLLGITFEQRLIVELAIKTLTEFAHIKKDADVLIFERVEEIHIQMLRDSNNFEGAGQAIGRILQGLASFGERISHGRKNNFLLAIAEIYLLTEQPSLVAKLLAPVLNQPTTIANPRPYILLWVYYLIAQLELGQIDIMQRWASNALTYMRENKIDDEAGLALLHFFYRLSQKLDLTKRNAELGQFKDEILPILKEPQNRYYCIRFPFEMWVDCKVSGYRFSQKGDS